MAFLSNAYTNNACRKLQLCCINWQFSFGKNFEELTFTNLVLIHKGVYLKNIFNIKTLYLYSTSWLEF